MMTYRANKIRQTVSVKRWAGVLPLDPKPQQCETYPAERHSFGFGCGRFDPRPGYEQDRSKYE